MRNLLQITDLGSGTVQVSWQRGNAVPKIYRDCIPFADPLTEEDRKRLRWYLEDFLQFPYGAEQWKAEQVERKMEQWGEALFKQVFIKADIDPDPRGFYLEAVRDGLDKCELCISSDDPVFLAIPWELIRDPAPGRNVYLASLLKGLYRQRSEQPIYGDAAIDTEGPFRILFVIARPYEQDVAMAMVARPVIEALRPMRSVIDLELLRPPTFEALQRKLTDNPGHYHLVHFDGHGTFVGDGDPGPQQFGVRAGFGHLVFENDNGDEHVVTSQDLGQALQNARVPLFVMNACQSAQEGTNDPFSSVASRLVAIGAKGVVGMSYSVYATTASKFMERFYSKLVKGSTLSEAVAAARMKLHTDTGHESPVGPIELQDWMVPTLYQQEIGFVPVHGRGPEKAEEESDAAARIEHMREKAPEGKFGFIGRDQEILRLERALRDDKTPWVIISGMGGIGKTELAYGFGRWYAETGGCPGGVFVTSFKEKADFGQVIGSIVGFGTEFSMHSADKQKEMLVGFLKENPCLLIWDNFETVAGYPDREHAYASDQDRKELAGFLKALGDGKSRVVISTRHSEEEWLGVAASLVEISGLTKWDAGQMATNVLRTIGKKPDDFRDNEKYDELLGLLRGHPRSLEVVLPLLKRRQPEHLIDELQYKVGDPTSKLADESLRLAFSRMSERARTFLPIVGLFSSYVTTSVLGFLTGADSEIWDVYPDRPGKTPDSDEWEVILEEASAAGLVRFIAGGVFELHPTVPIFLRNQLVADLGEEALRKLDAASLKFYARLAATFEDEVERRDKFALGLMTVEQANLLRALRIAERQESWEAAQDILQTMNEYYQGEGRFDEWKAMRRRVLGRVGKKMPPDANRDRANLWMFLLGNEAISSMGIGEFDSAEQAYKGILDYLVALNDPAVEPKIATVYHQLGMIAEERHRYDETETWYKKALEIRERLGLESWAATDYHQLGRIAEERHRYDEAENWYKKALKIFERLGLEKDAADEYHQLGRIAQERHRYDEAETWCTKALKIFERLGLETSAAGTFGQLGTIAQQRQRYDEAKNWSRKALEIFERIGLESPAATTYHQLGRIAEERHRYDEAENWYKKALKIFERLGLESPAASTYHHLGIIAQERQRYDEAENWYKKALQIFERLGHAPLKVDTLGQLGLFYKARSRFHEAMRFAGEGFLIAVEHNMDVGIRLAYVLGQLLEIMGEEELRAAWSDAFPEAEPPVEYIKRVLRRIREAEEHDEDDGGDDEHE